MKSKLFLAPWGSHCGDRSLDSPEGKAELHPQHAVLEPRIPGAGMWHWEFPVLLVSPYHDFQQGLGGLLFWGPCDSSRAGLYDPRTSARGVSFPQATPGLQVSSQGWPRSREFLGSACLKLLTLLGVSLVVRAGSMTGCTWTSWAGPQTATQGHSPL